MQFYWLLYIKSGRLEPGKVFSVAGGFETLQEDLVKLKSILSETRFPLFSYYGLELGKVFSLRAPRCRTRGQFRGRLLIFSARCISVLGIRYQVQYYVSL